VKIRHHFGAFMVVCPLERFHSTDKAAAGHPSIPTRRREGRHKAAENHPKITPCLRKLEFPSLIIGVQLTQITFHIELEFWGKNRTERAAQAILDWKSLPRQRLQVSAGNRPGNPRDRAQSVVWSKLPVRPIRSAWPARNAASGPGAISEPASHCS
jgi:hypothetical protein